MCYSNTRIDRLRAKLKVEGLGALYVRNVSNIQWITAFDGVFDGENAHALLITPEHVFLHTDARYVLACKTAAAGSEVMIDCAEGTHAEWLALVVNEEELQDAPLGIENNIALVEYRKLQESLAASRIAPAILRETENFVLGLRAIKDAEEVRRMKAAQAITDAAFTHIVGYLRPGLTEREVQLELERFMLAEGGEALAFSSIVAAGANGANPHAIPGATKLKTGDSLVLDFGTCIGGYCSDMTRTVFLGKPSDRVVRAYNAVREANEKVSAYLKPGITGAQAQKLAEDILAARGFEGAMGHSLGHGVGLEVHEEPALSKKNTTALEPGNVVTVEPGVYLENDFGIRIEDFGVITDDGFEVFTQSSHDMVIIG